MFLLIVGVVLMVIGIALFLSSKKSLGKINWILNTDLSDLKNILETFESMNNAHGKGAFSLYTKVNGKAFSDNPLQSEFTKQACVYYRVLLEHEYETLVIIENKEGNTSKRWERKTEKLIDLEKKVANFVIKDEAGEISINTNNSGLTGVVSYSKFEKELPKRHEFNINFDALNLLNNSSSKTIGYRYEEKMIPIGQPLFVLGDVNDRNGVLMFSAPIVKNKPFIVSIKTEDEIKKEITSKAKNIKIAGLISMLLGLGLCIYSFLKWNQWV